MRNLNRPWIILIEGPRADDAASRVYRLGHIPLLTERLDLPTAHRLVERCDAVLQLPDGSKGDDDILQLAQAHGLPVFFRTDDLPASKAGLSGYAHYINSSHVRIESVRTLSDDWYVLRKTTFDLRRRDGSWQKQSREVYDRGNGAAILLYNRALGTVVLTRQFRFPTYVNGNGDGFMIEVCAGLLEGADPEERIKLEAEEETGYRVASPRKVFEAYMSPGSVTEVLYFFVAEYDPRSKVNDGGGNPTEGEDIEVLELPLQEALTMVSDGRICDAKTIMLLQYARDQKLLIPRTAGSI